VPHKHAISDFDWGMHMERTTRRWLRIAGLVPVLAVITSTPFSAQGGTTQGQGRVAVPLLQQAPAPMPPTRTGLGPQEPFLSPMAVSQIEEGRRSEMMDQPISLSFAEPVSIRDLLLLLVRETNISVVPDPDVDGTFTGELKNVTLRQALDLILRPHGLDSTFHENILRVTRRQLETRLFQVNYVATRRSGSRGTGSSGTTNTNSGQNGAGGGGGTAGGLAGGNTGFGFGGTQASVSGTDFGDVFEELQVGLQTLLSEEGRSNLDRKAGLLQVTDFPSNLDKIAVYLEAYENRVLRQVQIVAKIIEVELREDFSAGIDWATVFRSAGNAVTVTQRLAPTRGTGAFTMGVKIKDFAGMLEAFASQGKVNVMASPRVMAMNNEPAVMRVGTQDVFFVTTSQVDATTGQILQTVVTPQSITEGVVLSVTPQISGDGVIHMSITPSITERTGTATSRLGDQVPIVSVRETDTLVRVHEGETIVIAGLMQDRTSVEKSKVPVLGDVPLVGGLFRREDRLKRKTDLVILLTPTILAPGEIAAAAAMDQQRLYEQQRQPVRK
jgi:MSHA biogenesis protein MshL